MILLRIFYLQTIHSESKPMTYNTSTKSQNASPPLHKLRVTKRLPAEGLCESVLFGLVNISCSGITSNQNNVLKVCNFDYHGYIFKIVTSCYIKFPGFFLFFFSF